MDRQHQFQIANSHVLDAQCKMNSSSGLIEVKTLKLSDAAHNKLRYELKIESNILSLDSKFEFDIIQFKIVHMSRNFNNSSYIIRGLETDTDKSK